MPNGSRGTVHREPQEGDIVLVGSDGVFDNLYLAPWPCTSFCYGCPKYCK